MNTNSQGPRKQRPNQAGQQGRQAGQPGQQAGQQGQQSPRGNPNQQSPRRENGPKTSIPDYGDKPEQSPVIEGEEWEKASQAGQKKGQ